MAKKTRAYFPKDEPLNFWKPIPGMDNYLVSREGEIRRVWKSGMVTDLKPQRKLTDKGRPKTIRLTIAGKRKEYIVSHLVAAAFLGEPPEGMVLYHKNGMKFDNHVENLAYISRKKLGKKTGHKSNCLAVFKIDKEGNEIEIYYSAREAARQNYMSYQTVIDRCNHKVKNEFALADYSFRWSKELEYEDERWGKSEKFRCYVQQ